MPLSTSTQINVAGRTFKGKFKDERFYIDLSKFKNGGYLTYKELKEFQQEINELVEVLEPHFIAHELTKESTKENDIESTIKELIEDFDIDDAFDDI